MNHSPNFQSDGRKFYLTMRKKEGEKNWKAASEFSLSLPKAEETCTLVKFEPKGLLALLTMEMTAFLCTSGFCLCASSTLPILQEIRQARFFCSSRLPNIHLHVCIFACWRIQMAKKQSIFCLWQRISFLTSARRSHFGEIQILRLRRGSAYFASSRGLSLSSDFLSRIHFTI